ncbi:MAG TPA: glycoside hydrolase family 2 TIM barrel-domain containing protein [Acidimicrobiales bacterium]|nr:glycoside hydrolase family 2 TIM barrel-domain containing protein [Acidimicrobiales bacterium]
MGLLEFDSRGVTSLDGDWDFFPGDGTAPETDAPAPETIAVPGLWEAQGHLELDGPAWYRHTFTVDDLSGYWTLAFGAVMDLAEVYLNGTRLGAHENAFTPFEFDAGPALIAGTNVLTVRVVDPPLDDPEHLRTAHGKQGWMNQVFPSRPSLYMTYGGIWQSVTLRRHGPVVLREVFVNSDPDDLAATLTLENRSPGPIEVEVGVRTLGRVVEVKTDVPGNARAKVRAGLGRVTGSRWSPDEPALHDLVVDAHCQGRSSDVHSLRYGLRTVRVDGKTLLVNEEPYRMKSVLVQGFTARELYAEGSDDDIRNEVLAAKKMGFNTLRLHIKAFDPRYLDVCDRVGMWLHCDLPVAEPIRHEEMGAETVLGRRCVAAAREQVTRDRNHPSIVLWSAMNELCDGRPEARLWPRYEEFARAVVAAVNEADGTRPVIENDWVEPDPAHVYASEILTAHWYGQLNADYLRKIERACTQWSGQGRPFFVTEYGDWGLPDMPELTDIPFWDTRSVHAAGLAGSGWPGSIGRFVLETQRHQGLSDRMQTEVWRRHDDVGGYCLTELTDVPHELNGLLDLRRQPKPLAVAEMSRANQPVLPMLRLETLVVAAGDYLRAEVHVANDGPELADVVVEARFGDTWYPLGRSELLALDTSGLEPAAVVDRFAESTARVRTAHLQAHRPSALGQISIGAPEVPGNHDLVLRLTASDIPVASNRYPIHVVDPLPVPNMNGSQLLVVAEGALDQARATEVRAWLATGGTAVVLAQSAEAAEHYPVPVTLAPVVTAWGSNVFPFTTDHGAIPSLPRRNILVGEDATVQATTVIASVDGQPFPDTPVVIAYKPVPGALTGTIVGSHTVGPGRLVFCQYRLSERLGEGDAAAVAILGDLLKWASIPRPTMHKRAETKPDGRAITYYTWKSEAAR